MKFIGVSILILLLMTQAFSHWFVVMAFNINKEYIAKNLCENRYRPQLHCNGNCVLMKKMKQAEKQEQDAPSAVKIDVLSIFLSSRSFFDPELVPVFIPKTPYFTTTHSAKPIDRAIAIFHPPSA